MKAILPDLTTLFNILPYCIGMAAILTIGYLDFRVRCVEHEWLYLVLVLCGIFTGGLWFEKIMSLVFVPVMLIFAAWILAKFKNRGRPEEDRLDTIDIVGGADIKTIASIGFWAGPYMMFASILIALPLAIVFFFVPSLGMKKEIKVKNEGIGANIPFCTLIATAYLFMFYVGPVVR